MDPLSITASAIAILEAVTGTSKGIGKLVSLRKAPAAVQALSNEAEAFRSVLVIVQCSLRHLEGSRTYEESGDAIRALLQDAKQSALELQCKIEYQLRRGVEVDKNGLPRISRMTWMRSSGQIEDLRQKIRDARDNLLTGLQAMNIHISEKTRQTTVQLQSISAVNTYPSPEITAEAGSTALQTQSYHERELDVPTDESVNAENDHQALQQDLESDLQVFRQTTPPQSSTIRVTTSVSTQQCPRFCRCQCHERSHIRSPLWLRAAVGQMLLTYHGLLRTTPCNYPPCRQTTRKQEFTYYFPRWLAQKALILSSTSTLSGYGASISIAIPVVIAFSDPIWTAIAHANMSFLQQRFSEGFSPYVINQNGKSLASQAVEYFQPEILRFLIQQGAKSDWRDSFGMDAQAVAMLSGPVYGVHNFGWDSEEVAEAMDFSSLHTAVAIQFATAEELQSLLHWDFKSVSSNDSLGMTPLHWAARHGSSEAVKLLVEWNADINAKDYAGHTPLHDACWSGSLRCVNILVDAGANVNSESATGATPLFFVNQGASSVISMLVQRGANINHRNHNGLGVLHYVARLGYSASIMHLLMHGADVNALDHVGLTPIQSAISVNSPNVVSALLRFSKLHGDPLDLVAGPLDGNTLHITADNADAEIMRLLAKEDLAGVDPMAKDENGMTPSELFDHNWCGCEVEEAWSELLQSACRQNNIDFASFNVFQTSSSEDKESTGGSSVEMDGQNDFVDAL